MEALTMRKEKRMLFALGFETIEIQRAILKGWGKTLSEICEQKQLADECAKVGREYHVQNILDLKKQVMDALYPPMTEAEKGRCKKIPLFEEDTIYTDNLIKQAGL